MKKTTLVSLVCLFFCLTLKIIILYCVRNLFYLLLMNHILKLVYYCYFFCNFKISFIYISYVIKTHCLFISHNNFCFLYLIYYFFSFFFLKKKFHCFENLILIRKKKFIKVSNRELFFGL